MRGLLAVLAWQVLPVPLALLGLPGPWVLSVQLVLLVPLVLWALRALKAHKG